MTTDEALRTARERLERAATAHQRAVQHVERQRCVGTAQQLGDAYTRLTGARRALDDAIARVDRLLLRRQRDGGPSAAELRSATYSPKLPILRAQS
jgi:hypothetical protein